ncbi:MAG TPA: penicillin-binding transpeptidase domain-containing protein, partial [Caldisericia bacterium]|nr:penicillin-binding transpeptidase domain-containing protein [Caldisericia bacterium]
LLTEVVDMKEDGVHQAKIPGYSVAGKTGTTPKTTASGDYQFSKFDCSFCGIVPSDPLAPQKLVVLVAIDEPYKTTASGGRINPFGSTTAAPCFKRIAERILSDLRIAPKEIK